MKSMLQKHINIKCFSSCMPLECYIMKVLCIWTQINIFERCVIINVKWIQWTAPITSQTQCRVVKIVKTI